MTKRATILLLTTILAAGPAVAQTSSPPAADETPAATAPEASEATGSAASDFTPVDIDDPQVPEPIASRAVPPDYTQSDSEARAGAESENTSPAEPQPTPAVDDVPTEPEQSVMSPEAAEAFDAPSNEASAHAPAAAPEQSPESAEVDADGVATAETPPDPAMPDGTSPGSAGSSGWTGGLGGSMIGTNPAGAVPESTTWQPPTARGLDLQG